MIVPSVKAAAKYIDEIRRAKIPVALDTETYGVTVGGVKYSALMLNRARMLTFQLSARGFPSLVFVSNRAFEQGIDFRKVLPHLKRLAMDPDSLKVLHNLNYDANVLLNHGIRMQNTYCTMVAGACADENMSNSLKERSVLVGRLMQKTKTVDFSDAQALADYGAEDTDATLDLFEMYEGVGQEAGKPIALSLGGKKFNLGKTKKKDPGLQLNGARRRFYSLQEMPMVNLVIKMERKGVRIDLKKLKRIDDEISGDKAKHLKEIYEHAGRTFNLNAPKQVGTVLYEELGLECPEDCYTKTGAPQTNARTLWYINSQHPIVDHIMAYKKLEKLQGNYTNPASGLPFYCDDSGFIHATANNVGTHTFRFSYSQPNLQTIPSRMDKYGIRTCFIAPDGYKVAVFDYSQIEVRMQALFSGDPIMVEELCKKKGDIYLRTAAEFSSEDPAKDRAIFKVVVLALQYGMGAYTLADKLTQSGYPTSRSEAQQHINTYFGSVYRELPNMWYDLFQEHQRKGYVTTLLGRPRKVKDFETKFVPGRRYGLNKFERAVVNNVMQGSAADWIKQAMLRLQRAKVCKQMGYSQRLQIHDEIFGYIKERHADEFEEVKRIAVLKPKAPFLPTRELVVPIRAEGGVGDNWVEAK